MKKKNRWIYLISTLIITIGGIAILIDASRPPNIINYQFTCGIPYTRIDTTTLKPSLVFNPPFRWEEKVLKVYFIDVTNYNLITKTLEVAGEWSKPANIKFVISTKANDSHIRVSFRQKRGYQSLIGNSASHPSNFNKSTLWLQDLDKMPYDEFRRVVLHEFGHAIGLEHELQNPNAILPWDSAAVYHYYDSLYHWKPDSVNKFVFTKIVTGEASDFDPKSIMIYATPGFLLKTRVAIPWPNDLSAVDKTKIKKYYPY